MPTEIIKKSQTPSVVVMHLAVAVVVVVVVGVCSMRKSRVRRVNQD
jgi:hypothetical protein